MLLMELWHYDIMLVSASQKDLMIAGNTLIFVFQHLGLMIFVRQQGK